MAIPIANLSAILTGAAEAAKAVATEMLPAAVTRDAFVEATRASVAWLATHLWVWLAMARAVAMDHLPTGAAAGSALEAAASGPWIQAAARLYRWLAAAVIEKLPDVAAEKLLGDAAAWLMGGRGGLPVVYAAVAVAFLAAAFLGGAVCALTCRTMKEPGLGGARVPRAVFRASPRRYYAAVRTARKAQRGGCGGAGCRMLLAGLAIAVVAYYLATLVLN